MSVKFANNAHSTLASSLSTSATSITVASGHGARFPSLSGSEFFYATLIDTSNNLEIVKVTARSTDVLTATRAQESTSARAFASGDRIELRVTAQALVDLQSFNPTDSVGTDAIIDNAVTAAKLNISGNGTSGQAVLTDGDGSFSYGTVSSGFTSMQTFRGSEATGGTSTWTRPSGITKVKVTIVGAGGGSQSVSSNNGAAGGAGGLSIAFVDVSSISSVTVTLGTGGAGSSGSSRGSTGGTSSFGSYVTATGGEGGFSTGAPYDGGFGGIGTTSVTGAVTSALNIRGNGGGRNGGTNHQAPGPGSFFGGGGVGSHDTSSTPGQGQRGEHGGGAGTSQYSSAIAGGAGVCLVEEFK